MFFEQKYWMIAFTIPPEDTIWPLRDISAHPQEALLEEMNPGRNRRLLMENLDTILRCRVDPNKIFFIAFTIAYNGVDRFIVSTN